MTDHAAGSSGAFIATHRSSSKLRGGCVSGPRQRLGFWYRLVAHSLRPILMAVTRRDWRSAENLPGVGVGVVLAPNHVSYLDPLTLAHFLWDNGRAPRYLAKESLFRLPLIGRVIAACGQIPVYRESKNAARALRAAVAAVQDGECVVIYPEGTITKDPRGWPMAGKTGAARVALDTGCPLIPIAQWCPQDILPRGALRPRLWPRRTIRVLAGPPVQLDDLREQPNTPAVLRTATDRILAAITGQLAELRGELPPAVRYDPALPSAGDTRDTSTVGEEG
ncbi:MAG: 1-acyl-sn-glycerol-3-phosphate acyltransferase [Jiangellaceae bacterium]|nr:1-acyl-sn-glycerol-3-phosphate acyltransferase [Jiangellaceae bacterium]